MTVQRANGQMKAVQNVFVRSFYGICESELIACAENCEKCNESGCLACKSGYTLKHDGTTGLLICILEDELEESIIIKFFVFVNFW